MNSFNLIENGITNPIISFVAGHLTHATLVTAGIITSLLFFDQKISPEFNWKIIGLFLFFLITGYLLRPYFGISKIKGTPSWTMYSAAICYLLFYFLYWLMEIKKQIKWSNFFMPAASNPLLICILPGVLYYFSAIFNIHFLPDYMTSGILGILWAFLFSTIMLWIMKVCNKYKIQLHL
ncbi:hypothetical protein [Flavobacterium adhaerens]|uniref:hypothetical protein n=1 Tax=Flavobacterium adhaerens TaxID=3149043 RepID=UPI0032B48CA3